MNRKDRRAKKFAHMSKKEKINHLAAKADKLNAREVDEMILWILHYKYGFGLKRLHDFYATVIQEHRNLTERYEMNVDSTIHQNIVDLGIDLDEWEKEFYADEDDV